MIWSEAGWTPTPIQISVGSCGGTVFVHNYFCALNGLHCRLIVGLSDTAHNDVSPIDSVLQVGALGYS